MCVPVLELSTRPYYKLIFFCYLQAGTSVTVRIPAWNKP